MLQTEYLRNLNTNYERLLLDGKPEENRYQYGILNRGGIKGLLPCSLRYINGLAYLYYDISSKQTVAQLFGSRCITRQWMKDFIWSMRQLRQELERFLLDDHNILWYPEQIFQDLENNVFSFLYVPYYDGEKSFGRLMDFWIEHIDYDDQILVDFVYHMYEQMDRSDDVYLQALIFEDAKILDQPVPDKADKMKPEQETVESLEIVEETSQGPGAFQSEAYSDRERREERKSFFGLFEGKRRKNREVRESYKREMRHAMGGYAVAEELPYDEEDYGRTIYIEETAEEKNRARRLYSDDDKLLATLDKSMLSIGKKRGEADVVLEDSSVSRLHARIVKEGEEFYLEDLNSTNGTFKNGLRLQPYEKRRLDAGDELRCGRVTIIFR